MLVQNLICGGVFFETGASLMVSISKIRSFLFDSALLMPRIKLSFFPVDVTVDAVTHAENDADPMIRATLANNKRLRRELVLSKLQRVFISLLTAIIMVW
jgi:hypothetical protein